MHKEKIGTIFVKAGLISHDALHRALEENRARPHEKLGRILVRLNLATDAEVARTLSLQSNIPYIELNMVVVDPSAVKKVPPDVCMKHHILPIYIEKNNLVLAIEDPYDFEAVEAARFASGLNVRPHVAAFSEIIAGIKRYHSIDESVSARAQNANPDDELEFLLKHIKPNEEQLEDLKKQSEAPAIVKIVNTIIFQGIAVRAGAILFEPQKTHLLIKNRVDGVLVDGMKVPKNMQAALITHIKILGGMDFTKRLIPQKGRTQFKMYQRVLDMEISCLPSQHGESLIIQLLDTGETIPAVNDLGLQSDEMMKILKLLSVPHGMTLICGPPGSGKTTTLYALAHELSRHQRKIVTIEESIEYQLKGANQVQINQDAGLTFHKALQSVLRHNPDVIVLGEIREKDSAEKAMQASQQGHLVLGVVRANNIIATISRLINLGVAPNLFASSLSGIITQRLVRKICTQCREKYQPSPKLLKKIEARIGETLSDEFYRGKGCQACNYTGYHDRVGVYYIVPMSQALARLIQQGPSESRIGKIETALLTKNLLAKIEQGETTVEELERVLFPDKTSQTFEKAHQAPAAPPAKQVEKPSQQKPSKARHDTAQYMFKNCKILVVDSDQKITHYLSRALSEKHFTVTTATDGQEALEKIIRNQPHLILTETVLPKLDGLGLIRQLRREGATSSIPVIIVSSKGKTVDRIKGFAAGTDDYVPKPFSIHELFFRINAILRRTYKP